MENITEVIARAKLIGIFGTLGATTRNARKMARDLRNAKGGYSAALKARCMSVVLDINSTWYPRMCVSACDKDVTECAACKAVC